MRPTARRHVLPHSCVAALLRCFVWQTPSRAAVEMPAMARDVELLAERTVEDLEVQARALC